MTTQEVTVPHLFSKLSEQYQPRFEIDQRHIRMILLDFNMQINTLMTINADPNRSFWRPDWESLFICSGEMEVKVIGLQMHAKMRIDPPFNIVIEELDWNIRDLVIRQLSQRMFSMELLWSIGISSAWWLKRRLRADPEYGDILQLMSVPRQIKNKAINFNHQLPALSEAISKTLGEYMKPLFPFKEKLVSHVFPQLVILRGRLVLMVHYLALPPEAPLPFGLSEKDIILVPDKEKAVTSGAHDAAHTATGEDENFYISKPLWAIQESIIWLYHTLIKESILKEPDEMLEGAGFAA
jgi:hypothetical protein